MPKVESDCSTRNDCLGAIRVPQALILSGSYGHRLCENYFRHIEVVMNRQHTIDPDPFTIGLGIIASTAAVVGKIDVIRRAKLQEKKDKEDSEYREREEERRDRELENQERAAIQREELLKLDAILESLEQKISSTHAALEDGERIPNSSRWIVSKRAFYRYSENVVEISKTNVRIIERVLAIEPTLDKEASLIPDYVPIVDEIEHSVKIDRLLVHTFKQSLRHNLTPYSQLGHPYSGDENPDPMPLDAALDYVKLARKQINYVLL